MRGEGGGMSKSGAHHSSTPPHGACDRSASDGTLEYKESNGTSIFDPVLCELAYRWFCPVGGTVLDPFAGGSVRGIVAGLLGRKYTGLELRSEQVEANRSQVATIFTNATKPKPVWITTDSLLMDDVLPADFVADMVFSCPPYADLEVYSDDPADISNKDYPEFMRIYSAIIQKSISRLKPNGFAVWVVGDVRDKNGNYHGFVPDTIRAFQEVGAAFYNEAILVTAVGSLPIRAGRSFESSRKLGKTHQNVLVFIKGDAKKAVQSIGPVEFGEVPDGQE